MADEKQAPAKVPSFYRTIERVLLAAAADPAFCERLVRERAVAAAHHGFELTPAEQLLLVSPSDENLRGVIQRLAGGARFEEESPLERAVAGGIRPDRPR